MTFHAVGIRHRSDGLEVDGELTWHGAARPVTLTLDLNGFTHDPDGNPRAGFSATTELDRGDVASTTNIPMDGGGWASATGSGSSLRSKPSPTTPAGHP